MTYDGDFAADFEAALLELLVFEQGGVGGQAHDGARCLHAQDLGVGLDGVQALPIVPACQSR